MKNLSTVGSIFYGLAIASMGLQAIYSGRFPYMLIPPTHFSPPVLAILAYITGTVCVLSGVCITFNKMGRFASLLLGCLLSLIFCFGFIPYEVIANPNYLQFGEWENAEKELALSAGAFVIAGSFSGENKNSGLLTKLIPFGAIVFALTMLCFGIDHFLEPKGVAEYMPGWIPYPIFWAYFCGIALIGAGVAIILKIKTSLFATLLGIMIFSWFIILHIPKVIVAPSLPEMRGELTSAFLALAYSGIAFVIAGIAKK